MELYPTLAALTLSFGASACAMGGDYPSLEKRSFETAPAEALPPMPVAAPADAALKARIETLLANGRSGSGAFDLALAKAKADVISSSGSGRGSEAWIAAQMSVSRTEPTLEPTMNALAGLDNEKRQIMLSSGSAEDIAALDAAIAELSLLADRQGAAVRALSKSLNR